MPFAKASADVERTPGVGPNTQPASPSPAGTLRTLSGATRTADTNGSSEISTAMLQPSEPKCAFYPHIKI